MVRPDLVRQNLGHKLKMVLKNEFLDLFVKEMILHSARPATLAKMRFELEERADFKKRFNQSVNVFRSMRQRPVMQKQIMKPVMKPEPVARAIEVNERKFEKAPLVGGQEGIDKIMGFMADKSVLSIECVGPNTSIKIRRLGKNITTPIRLKAEEIESIFDYISQRTRIPRIGGIFKVIYRDLVVNATESDFGGPRFLITRIRLS